MLGTRAFNSLAVTEASIFKSDKYKVARHFGNDVKVDISDLDAECLNNVGGTAWVTRGRKEIVKPGALSPNLLEILDQGRVGLYGFEPITNKWVASYIVYGKTSGTNIL